jgi:hypothetical protein
LAVPGDADIDERESVETGPRERTFASLISQRAFESLGAIPAISVFSRPVDSLRITVPPRIEAFEQLSANLIGADK